MGPTLHIPHGGLQSNFYHVFVRRSARHRTLPSLMPLQYALETNPRQRARMPIEQLILLALIQGLTEFLPISSSAHLILLPQLTSFEDQGVVIDVAVHVGSLGAVVLYFRSEVTRMTKAVPDLICFRITQDAKLLWFLGIGTIPAILAGLLLATYDIDDAMRTLEIIAWTSILYGILLYVADRLSPSPRDLGSLTFRDVMWIGLSQALAMIPGTSRSGITMTAGRFLGFSRTEAARFSMLLSIPTILASGAYKSLELINEGASGQIGDVMIVIGLSFGAAYASIWVFLKLLEKISFTPFVIYRVALGIGLLWLIN